MFFQQLLQKVLDHETVRSFLFEHERAYLTHLFKMDDKANEDEWQIGFFDPQERLIHVFIYDTKLKTLIKNPGEQSYQEPTQQILPLMKEKVLFDVEEAINQAKATAQKQWKDPLEKTILLLQQLPELGTVYNITFLTSTFKTINIKINATTGEVITANIFSLMDFAHNKDEVKKFLDNKQ